MEPMNKDERMGVLIERLNDTIDAAARLEGRFDKLEARVEDKFRTAESLMRVVRFIGLTVVAILTFKFGDVSRLWTHFFG